jgi:hypothetical protein
MIQRAAINIAGKGKPTFPCKKDKSPCTPRGFKDATNDPGLVTALWTRYGGEKIGMPTGEASGIFVVDVDRLEALEELDPELLQALRETLTIRTPSGGLHYYLNHIPGVSNRTGQLPAGIDIRGEGGYVISPPSEGYTVEHRAPIADAPEQLLEALRDKPSGTSRDRSRSGESVPDDGEPIPDGTRDETLTRVAGRLHDGTRDLAQLEEDLQAVNEARCIPPLPPGQVRKISRSVYRYEPCRPARREPDPDTVQGLAAIEQGLLRREWRGQSGKTAYSISVAALKLARRYGELVEDGVRLEVSARQLALAAAVSRRTIVRKLKSMGGILRPDNENAGPGKSGAIVLLTPCAACHHSTHRDSHRERQGGCDKLRAPLTAPRLRWSSPACKPKRGVTPGTSKVRYGVASKRRDAVIRLGKGCERVMDSLEAAGGSMTLSALADAVDVKRPRDLTRRKNLAGEGRDGFVARLEGVGVLTVAGDTVSLTDGWLEALDRERERSGEIARYQRDMRRYNEQSRAYRHKVKADRHCVNAGADGNIEDLRPVPEPAPGESALARAVRLYLDRNPGDACQPPGWIGTSLWALELFDGKPARAEVEAALVELGGEAYLRSKLRVADGTAA